MNNAIKKAIEGGYDAGLHILETGKEYNLECVALLNPLFWQALGKAMGWKKVFTVTMEEDGGDHDLFFERCVPEWKYNMYRFIDRQCEGFSQEVFFKDLLA